MKLLAVNTGLPRTMTVNGREVSTGIFKQTQPGRVMLRRANLEGDRQADLTVHGGVDKAVYLYPHEHYPWFQQALGRSDFVYGQFGENFTVEGLLEGQVKIGDRLRIGEALIEISQPRVPCFKLGLRMGTSKVIALFLESRKTGFYARVLREGLVGAGDPFELEFTDPDSLTVDDIMRLRYQDKDDFAGAARASSLTALTQGWREEFAERLATKG